MKSINFELLFHSCPIHRTRIDFYVSHCSDEIISILLKITFVRNIKCKLTIFFLFRATSHIVTINKIYGNFDRVTVAKYSIFKFKIIDELIFWQRFIYYTASWATFICRLSLTMPIITLSLWFTFNFSLFMFQHLIWFYITYILLFSLLHFARFCEYLLFIQLNAWNWIF